MAVNKKYFRLKTLHVFLFLGLLGCLTPIDFPVEIAGGRLVVSGQISTISDQNSITLGTTATTARLPLPVTGASIAALDDQGNSFSYIEDLSKPGLYRLNGAVGIPGTLYHVEIELPNGEVYESVPEKMPEPAILDSVYYEIVYEDIVDAEGAFTRKAFLKIYSNSTITQSTSSYLKWGVEEAFLLSPTDFPDNFGIIPPPCYIVQNADPQRVVLHDGLLVGANKIQGQLLASRIIDWTFIEKHIFTIYQSSITKESLDYWRKVNILSNQVGSIFDTPPAEITGNISNKVNLSEEVLGYFHVVNQNSLSFVLYEVDLPFPLLVSRCDFDGIHWEPSYYMPRCIECTSVRNSSYERPGWF